MRVFLDANILFSAAKSDGAIRRLLREILDRGHECCADSYVVAEACRNLVIKGPEAIQTFDALLDHVSVAAASATVETEAEVVAWLPDDDRPVLAAAIRLRCNALVTGDHTHFVSGYGRVFADVAIHSPRSLAEILLAG